MVLRRRKWIVVAVTVVTVAVSLAVSLAQTPIYESRTELLISSIQRVEDAGTGAASGVATNMATAQRIIVSDAVRAEAAGILGLDFDDERLTAIRVDAIANTSIVQIIATDTNPITAASIANTYAQAYLNQRLDEYFVSVQATRDALDARIRILEARIVETDQAIASSEANAPGSGGSLQLDRDLLFNELTGLIERRDALIDDPERLTAGGSVLRPAVPATTPLSPQPRRTGILALVLGLTLGIALAFLRDFLDDVVRDDDDLKRATGQRPILGRIPRWEAPDGRKEGLVTLLEPSSIAAETYRELSANVRFLTIPASEEPYVGGSGRAAAGLFGNGNGNGGGNGGSGGAGAAAGAGAAGGPRGRRGSAVLVVSATAGNGKSVTAGNLAVSAARAGQRVVLVDADLRRPRLARQFGLGRSAGLSDLLASHGPVDFHLMRVGVPNLRFLPAGSIPPNPAELLASRAMRQLNEELVAEADLVIYDTPALLAVPDALELGRLCDLAILVGQHTVSSRREIAAVIERLEQIGVDVAGSVLNNIDTKADAYYYYYTYYYRTYYSDRPGDAERQAANGNGNGRGGSGGSGGGSGSSGRGRRGRRAQAARAAERAAAVSSRRAEVSAAAEPVGTPGRGAGPTGAGGPAVVAGAARSGRGQGGQTTAADWQDRENDIFGEPEPVEPINGADGRERLIVPASRRDRKAWKREQKAAKAAARRATRAQSKRTDGRGTR